MGGWISGVLRWLVAGRMGGATAAPTTGGTVCATVSLFPAVAASVTVAPSVTASAGVEQC
jgi:hypothetical protein